MVDTKKELEPRVGSVERVVVPEVEVPKSPEQNLEVESWVEKIEKRFGRVPGKTSNISDDTVVVQQPAAQQPLVTLPVTQQQMQAWQKAKTDRGIAWLVTWAVRQIKMLTKLGRNVRLQDIPEVKK
jgi:hypothetical protein